MSIVLLPCSQWLCLVSLLARRELNDLKRPPVLPEQFWFSICCLPILSSGISPWEQPTEEIGCHGGDESLNTSIRSLQGPMFEKQLIWILVLTGARKSLDSSIFLPVWYCLTGSLKVAYFSFCIIAQQYWWLPSKHTHFPDRLPILHLEICVFFLNCVCMLLSQAHLWHLPGSLAWNLGCFFSSFLPSLCFPVSRHTLHGCASLAEGRLQCLLPYTWHFISYQQDKTVQNQTQDTFETAKIQPRIQHLSQNAYKSTIHGSCETPVKKVTMQSVLTGEIHWQPQIGQIRWRMQHN